MRMAMMVTTTVLMAVMKTMMIQMQNLRKCGRSWREHVTAGTQRQQQEGK